jgi:hypothetical protein
MRDFCVCRLNVSVSRVKSPFFQSVNEGDHDYSLVDLKLQDHHALDRNPLNWKSLAVYIEVCVENRSD